MVQPSRLQGWKGQRGDRLVLILKGLEGMSPMIVLGIFLILPFSRATQRKYAKRRKGESSRLMLILKELDEMSHTTVF